MTPERHPGDPVSPVPWSNVVNGCAHNDKIRRDALIALGLVLIAVVAITFAVAGTLGPMVKEAIGNTIVRIVAGSLLAGGALGYGGLRLHRRRARNTQLPAAEEGGEGTDRG